MFSDLAMQKQLHLGDVFRRR